MNADARTGADAGAQDWLRRAETLAAVLEAENAALLALDLGAAGVLLRDKQRAAAALAGLPRPDATDAAPPRARVLQLAALAQENKRLLEHAITVQGRVVAMLTRAMPAALARHAGSAPRYGAGGRVAPPSRPGLQLRARV